MPYYSARHSSNYGRTEAEPAWDSEDLDTSCKGSPAYSRAKGAFAGLTLEGASLRQDDDSRRAMYGCKVTTRELLLGQVPATAAAQPFLAEIHGAKAQATAEGKTEAKEKDKK